MSRWAIWWSVWFMASVDRPTHRNMCEKKDIKKTRRTERRPRELVEFGNLTLNLSLM